MPIYAAAAAASRSSRSPSVVSLSDDDERRDGIPPSKRTKTSAAANDRGSTPPAYERRLEQNRSASRRCRLRKKLREEELRRDVDRIDRANESLRKRNDLLQLLLAEARAKVAAPSSSDEPDLPCGRDPIDVLLESDDWLYDAPDDEGRCEGRTAAARADAPASAEPAVVDRERNAAFCPPDVASPERAPSSSAAAPPVPPPLLPFPHPRVPPSAPSVVPPSSPRAATRERDRASDEEGPADRRERNRRAARRARLARKLKHEALRSSAESYARSNEKLRHENEELRRAIHKARCQVARAASRAIVDDEVDASSIAISPEDLDVDVDILKVDDWVSSLLQ
ncbi:hypothetical protein ACHAWF_006551 [Thalassiosira exigua]